MEEGANGACAGGKVLAWIYSAYKDAGPCNVEARS